MSEFISPSTIENAAADLAGQRAELAAPDRPGFTAADAAAELTQRRNAERQQDAAPPPDGREPARERRRQ